MQHLKIALVQADLIWHDIEENIHRFSSKIDQIQEKVDLIILPEMFTTGFTMLPQEVAETMEGITVTWLTKKAIEKDTAIAGSGVIKEGNSYFNRFLFVFPDGAISYYDKKHLFTLAGEDKVYTSGSQKIIIEYKGWKICPLICYDLRFPVWARNVEDYEVLLYVANWPKTRILAWDALLKARAIENMSYTVGVNRVGIDGNSLEYVGHSAVYDCLGEKIVDATPSKEEVIITELSKSHLNLVKEKLRFLEDRDNFSVH